MICFILYFTKFVLPLLVNLYEYLKQAFWNGLTEVLWSSVRLSIVIFASVPPFFNFQSKELPANSRRISGRGGREATSGNASTVRGLSKDQLIKKKDRILIKDIISNKWKYKTKEARLILQSGIYIYFYQYFGRHSLPSRSDFWQAPKTTERYMIQLCACVSYWRGQAVGWCIHGPWFKSLPTIYFALVVSA